MVYVDLLLFIIIVDVYANRFSLRKLKFGECFISHTIGGADLNLGALKNLSELTINDNLLITDRVSVPVHYALLFMFY